MKKIIARIAFIAGLVVVNLSIPVGVNALWDLRPCEASFDSEGQGECCVYCDFFCSGCEEEASK